MKISHAKKKNPAHAHIAIRISLLSVPPVRTMLTAMLTQPRFSFLAGFSTVPAVSTGRTRVPVLHFRLVTLSPASDEDGPLVPPPPGFPVGDDDGEDDDTCDYRFYHCVFFLSWFLL